MQENVVIFLEIILSIFSDVFINNINHYNNVFDQDDRPNLLNVPIE